MPMKFPSFFGSGSKKIESVEVSPSPVADRREFLDGLDAGNTEVRHPVALLLDCSGSMGQHMSPLNAAIKDILEYIQKDEFLRKSVELCIIRVGGSRPTLLQAFAAVDEIAFNDLHSSGGTPLYGGVLMAIQQHESRRHVYRDRGVDWKKSMTLILTDGKPGDVANQTMATAAVTKAERARNRCDRIAFFAFATLDANVTAIQRLIPRGVKGVNKEELHSVFEWLKASLDVVSTSVNDDDVTLPNPDDFGFRTF